MLRAGMLIVAACLFSTEAAAGCKWGDTALGREHYKMAVSQYTFCQLRGDAHAMHQLGGMYYRGLGVEKDERKAILLFRDAANQNHHPAQAKLGLMFWRGEAVPSNPERAYKWLVLASDSGNDTYEAYLKRLERGMSKQQIQAGLKRVLEWRLERALKGNVEMQLRVAVMYWKGEGTERNPFKAYGWLSQADRAGVAKAGEMIGMLEKRLNREQQEKARNTARQIAKKVAEETGKKMEEEVENVDGAQ